MDNRRSTQSSTFNIFVFGVIVGIALTLLLTTKKGRKLLRFITEEGVHRLSEWEEKIMAVEDKEEIYDEDDELVLGEDYQEEGRDVTGQTKDLQDDEKATNNSIHPSKPRRFFKGVKKKTS